MIALSEPSGSISYRDCDGLRSSAFVQFGQPITICSNNIISSNNVEFESFGCCGSEQPPSPSLSATPTPTPTPTPTGEAPLGKDSQRSVDSDDGSQTYVCFL